MKDDELPPPSARHWRDIPQQVNTRAMSRVGRSRMNRRMIRNLAIVIGVLAIGAGAFEVWRTLHDTPERIASVAGSHPVRSIEVETDGVLDHAWVKATLDLRTDVSLMELDLYSLRERLLATGQVGVAVLTREFPDTLRVVLKERSPVVRVRARLGSEAPRNFLVAQDGTVYSGHGYESDRLESLPWLAGVRMVRQKSGFAPLPFLEQVADLVATARHNVPRLFDSWRVVSLARMARDGEILVQASDIPEIIFGTEEDFYTQLARLDLIVEQARARSDLPLESINLAIGAMQVPVSFQVTEPLASHRHTLAVTPHKF